MGWLWTILVGFVAGLLARFLMPGRDAMGFILTTLLGIGGSVLSTYVGHKLGWYNPGEGAGFIGAVVGALLILAIYRMIKGKS